MAGEVKRLGELLVGKGLITPSQLQRALLEQRNTKEFLGSILTRNGWLKKEEVLKALAEQLDIPFVPLDVGRIDWVVARKFSPTAVMEHKTLPIAMDRTSVTVAMVNPLDVWGLESIERESGGREVRRVLVSEEDYALALMRYKQR